MGENNKQYVIYPHPGNDEKQPDLDPKDKLIYIAIRRYMNRSTMEAYPSYERITEDTGAAAKTIKKCVDSLVDKEYLSIRKEGRRIFYKFNDKKQFEPFSYDFLDNKNLTFTEKAYIVASQQYMFKENEEGKISFSNKELATKINMPETTISRVNHSLETKGFLKGSHDITKRFQLRELDQLFVWKFKEQDERITQNEDDIAYLKKELEQIKLENQELKNKLCISDKYIMS